jgi:hypothetical protein
MSAENTTIRQAVDNVWAAYTGDYFGPAISLMADIAKLEKLIELVAGRHISRANGEFEKVISSEQAVNPTAKSVVINGTQISRYGARGVWTYSPSLTADLAKIATLKEEADKRIEVEKESGIARHEPGVAKEGSKTFSIKAIVGPYTGKN